jgi:hypothetical protein
MVLLAPALGSGQQPPAAKVTFRDLDPFHFALDQVGRLRVPASGLDFQVKRVLGEGAILVQASGVGYDAWGQPFVLKGVTTRGVIDDSWIKLEDIYRVADTTKVGGRTVFLLQPAAGAEREKVETAEKAAPKAPAHAPVAPRKPPTITSPFGPGERPTPKGDMKRSPVKKPAPGRPAPAEPNPAVPDPEKDASRKLKFAKSFLDDGNKDAARKRLREIVDGYPDTKAGKEAKELLEKLGG